MHANAQKIAAYNHGIPKMCLGLNLPAFFMTSQKMGTVEFTGFEMMPTRALGQALLAQRRNGWSATRSKSDCDQAKESSQCKRVQPTQGDAIAAARKGRRGVNMQYGPRKDRFVNILSNTLGNGADDASVDVEEIVTGHARLARDTSGDNDNLGILQSGAQLLGLHTALGRDLRKGSGNRRSIGARKTGSEH